MALAFVASGQVDDQSGTSTSLAVPVPAGTVNGNEMVAYINNSANVALTAPGGWTLQKQTAQGAATQRLSTYIRTAGASEPASYTWTTASADFFAGCIQSYSGNDTVTQPDVATPTGTTGTTATATWPSITTVTANAWLLYGLTDGANPTGAATTPTGMTARVAIADALLVTFDQALGAAGAVAGKTSTISGTLLQWAAQSIALRPAGTAVIPPRPIIRPPYEDLSLIEDW